jgi:hypothetical protein
MKRCKGLNSFDAVSEFVLVAFEDLVGIKTRVYAVAKLDVIAKIHNNFTVAALDLMKRGRNIKNDPIVSPKRHFYIYKQALIVCVDTHKI